MIRENLSMAFKLRLTLVKAFDALCKIQRWRTLEKILINAEESTDTLFFIQIGANDGVIYDPIYKFVTRYNWKGILVEPVRCYFNRLLNNYRGYPNLQFENAAISDKDEQREFYRVQEGLDFLPEWCNGLGTFNLDVLLTHKWAIPNLEDYVVKETVQCLSLVSLLEKYAVNEIDLLLIDTEGYDYQILRQLDLGSIRPRILLYEHQYISREERHECEKRFRQHGYKVSSHMGNTLVYSV